MAEKVMYSNILQEFAKPLLYADDTNDVFITKMKVAELIWNYCIAKEFGMPVFDILHQAITKQNENNPEMKQVFNLFVKMKKEDFYQYKNFIVTVELRIKKEGDKTVYVESIHPNHFNNISNGAIRV